MFRHKYFLPPAMAGLAAVALSGCGGGGSTSEDPAVRGVISLVTDGVELEATFEGSSEGRRNGIAVVSVSADDDSFGYGGWLGRSGFVVGLVGDEVVSYTDGSDESSTAPDLGAEGFTADWRGIMIGMDGDMNNARVEGDAHLALQAGDGTSPVVDVEFTNITGDAAYADHGWMGISVNGGSFQGGTADDRVTGQFYGANHEEVVGTFGYDSLEGAYGAIRMRMEDTGDNGGQDNVTNGGTSPPGMGDPVGQDVTNGGTSPPGMGDPPASPPDDTSPSDDTSPPDVGILMAACLDDMPMC